MKKILSILGVISLVTTSTFTVVACGNPSGGGNGNNEPSKYSTIDKDVSYYTMSVGNGLFTFFQIEDKAIIYDAGVGMDSNPTNWTNKIRKGNTFVYDFMKEKGVNEIEAIFISHDHTDHYANLDYITKNMKINNIVKPVPNKSAATSFEDRIVHDKNKSNYSNGKIYIDPNTKIHSAYEKWYTFLGLNFRNLSYESQKNMQNSKSWTDPNNWSTVLEVNINETGFLLTGDADKTLGADIIENHKIDEIDVYQVPHHGSANAANAELLKDIEAEHCFISGTSWVNDSSGKWEKFGGGEKFEFPRDKTLENLKDSCSNVYVTGEPQKSVQQKHEELIKEIDKSYEFLLKVDGQTSINYYANTILDTLEKDKKSY